MDDYPKIFDYLLTKDGLIFLHDLKRKYVLGKDLELDQCNKLRLLQIYYATNNRIPAEVQKWKEMCMDLDKKGFSESDMYTSKKSLIDQNLITLNPKYQPGLYRQHIEFTKNNS